MSAEVAKSKKPLKGTRRGKEEGDEIQFNGAARDPLEMVNFGGGIGGNIGEEFGEQHREPQMIRKCL